MQETFTKGDIRIIKGLGATIHFYSPEYPTFLLGAYKSRKEIVETTGVKISQVAATLKLHGGCFESATRDLEIKVYGLSIKGYQRYIELVLSETSKLIKEQTRL